MQTAAKLKPQVIPRNQTRKQTKRRLKVVKPRKRLIMVDSASLFSLFLFLSFFLATGLIFNVSQRALIAQVALENKQLEDVLEKEQLKEQRLFIAKAKLNSPDRIEKIAVEKLGMICSSEVNYLELPSEIAGQKDSVRSSPSSTSKRSPSWRILKDRIVDQISLSSLSGLGLH